MVCRLLCALVLLLACLWGCGGGGGGGGGSQTIDNATFQISWPARTRDALTNPLTSAQSVAVTFRNASATGTDVTVNVDRDSTKLDAYTATYTVPQPIKSTVSTMVATFYAQAGEQGAVVGIASGTVTVSGKTLSLGAIVVNGTVKTVEVAGPATIAIGSPAIQLAFSAKDANGSLVAVSEGSEKWTQTSGTNAITVTPQGIATVIGPGTAQVQVTVDGITSAAYTITVPVLDSPSFRISWPERTRSPLAHSLSSALSAKVVFKQAALDGADVTVNVDRDAASTAAYTGTYTVPQQIRPAVALMTATFYAQTGQQGAVVGTATANVSASGNALVFSTIVVDGTIKTVSIVAPGSIDHQASPVQLQFTAKDGANNTVAVSAGSAKWTLVSGSSAGSLTADGVFTPSAAGTAQVKVAVDGVTSANATVTVTDPAAPTTMVISVPANDLYWDATRGCLWATVNKTGGTIANSIVSIDPITGAVGKTYPVGNEPDLIAVTDNGQYAYITSTEDQKVRRIDLSDGSVKLTVVTNQAYKQLITVPGSPNSFVGAVDPTGGVNVSVYDNDVRRSGTGAGGYCIHFGTSNTRLYGIGGNQMYRNTLSPTAITWNDQTVGLASGDFDYSNGLIYTVNGEVVNPETKASVGQFSTAHLKSDRRIAVSDSDDRIYMVTWPGTVGKVVLTFDKTTLAEKPLYDTGVAEGGAMHLVAAGPHAVAFHLYGDVTRKVVIVHNLP